MSAPNPPRPNTGDLIALDRATVLRGSTRALDAVTLRVPLGRHTAVLGANGCGKSTLIKLVTRELYALASDSGEAVRVFGQARWNVTALRADLGIVSHDVDAAVASLPGLRVADVVLGGLSARIAPPDGPADDAGRARVDEALARAHALPLRDRDYATLSTGEARRVLIARALVRRPRALLLDEPTTGLDPVARQRLLASLRELARDGVTLVIVTHHFEELVPEIDHVILLRAGRVLADGPRDAVLTDALLSQAFDAPLRLHRQADGTITVVVPP